MTHKEFVSYFQPDLFISELKAATKTGAIEEMVNHLVEGKKIRNGTIVLEALKKRESLGSTGIGKSLAIPHGRTTVTSHLTVVYARSLAGIPWESLDHKPVHFVFLILAPHQERENHYLPLLGKIVEFARDAGVRKRLLKVESHAELLEVLDMVKSK
jgi:mannitol/fructose-specific phosphotransferase system IIA component (Ntr-type)